MNQLEKFAEISTFFFDIDGVFTNNTLLITDQGEFLRSMNVRDGYAVKRAIRAGYQIVVITGGSSSGVQSRLQGLGIEHIYMGKEQKLEVFDRLVVEMDLEPGEILYLGDDLPDYPVMRKVGLPCCPADAVPEIMGLSKYVSPYKGGEGCVRDVIEKVMRIRGEWDIPQS
ncbi:MAG: HAD-IIIA family hydrolase [Saprospiraceae bacterium]|jgi:3-deoxy-D-manno-octulosonate 8-phosphate phosphatase (KDO 8-P phosphatase)|nr:HAD-IIIA family hydrolase [Saprospiraceae bacterium]MDP4819798.1 HAD-IIIA family hydrolase [Saprospiraceae bacterium]MDP4999174.1 HAD-IIIA family hydrolase [Saprospiraceae bacterium]